MKTLSIAEVNQVAGGVISTTMTFGPNDCIMFFTEKTPGAGMIFMNVSGAYYYDMDADVIVQVTNSNCKTFGFISFQNNGGGKYTYTLA